MENNLLKCIFKNFVLYADQTAIIYDGKKKYTYSQLKDITIKKAKKMIDMGINNGHRVLINTNNSVQFIAIFLALWHIGAVPIPLVGSLGEVELNDAMNESKAEWVISEENNISHEKKFIGLDTDAEASVFFYTTGTTGKPKCVKFDSESIFYNIKDLSDALNLKCNDILYAPMNCALTAVLTTVVLPALYAGAKLILSEKMLPRTIINTIVEQGVTIFFAVPYIYKLLLSVDLEKYLKKTKIRFCLSSSAVLEQNTIYSFFEKTGIVINSIYCSSEAGVIAFNDSKNIEIAMKYIGKPIGNTKVIVKSDATGLGEIIVKGNHVAVGYFNNRDIEKKVFIKEGIKTGDIGKMDSNGYISLVGRLSNTINIAGSLAYPEEIEKTILEIPEVEAVVVYGVKDELLGEIIAADIVVIAIEFDSNVIAQYCRKKLSNYKIPRQINFVDKIPKGHSGKIIRSKI